MAKAATRANWKRRPCTPPRVALAERRTRPASSTTVPRSRKRARVKPTITTKLTPSTGLIH